MAEVVIERRPFNSNEALLLIPKLDQELSDMYPDWSDLPHPGDDVGLKKNAPALNMKPENSNTVSILNDAEPDPEALGSEDKNNAESNAPVFFVAYTAGSSTQEPTEPIGCMAIKVEKYFPYHHPPEMYLDDFQEQVKQGIEREATIKTAQLKRLFVEKLFRSTSTKPSIAGQLLGHCEDFAKNNMNVRRLVVETGIRQIGAIKLYERAGYSKIENFGDYASSSVEQGGVSICYAKLL